MKAEIEKQIDKYITGKLGAIVAEQGFVENGNIVIQLTENEINELSARLCEGIRNIIEHQNEWFVMANNGKKPTHRHYDYHSALTEAQRIKDVSGDKCKVLLIYDETYDLPF